MGSGLGVSGRESRLKSSGAQPTRIKRYSLLIEVKGTLLFAFSLFKYWIKVYVCYRFTTSVTKRLSRMFTDLYFINNQAVLVLQDLFLDFGPEQKKQKPYRVFSSSFCDANTLKL